MSKSVVFSQCGRIACAGQSSPEVILCLADVDLLADNVCERTTIEGVLTNVYADKDCGKNVAWRYIVSYDENLLADPAVALISTDIVGIFCKSCLSIWVEDEISCNKEIITEVTTEELNTLVTNSYLVPGTFYRIIDHSQGTVPEGTSVIVQALDVNLVSSSCSVIISFDERPWRGIYDIAINKLTELADNQGNVCRQFPSTTFEYTPIDLFDWGNPKYFNCLIDNSWLIAPIGLTPDDRIDSLIMTEAGILDLTGWTGTLIQGFEVSKRSSVNLSGSGTRIYSTVVTQLGSLQVHSLDSLLSDSIITGSQVTIAAGTGATISHCSITGGSSVNVAGSGYLTLLETNIESTSGIVINAALGPNSNSSTIRRVTLAELSVIHITGTLSGFFTNISQANIVSRSTLDVGSISSDLTLIYVSMSDSANLQISGGGNVAETFVKQATLIQAGFDLLGVYHIGRGTKTVTANNTDTGKDYFNDTII